MNEKGICPRCRAKGVDLGSTIFQVGRTRALRLSTYNCSKCDLVFFEKTAEE